VVSREELGEEPEDRRRARWDDGIRILVGGKRVPSVEEEW
jgi:hypothetical protein